MKIPLHARYSLPSFDSTRSIEVSKSEAVQLGRNPFTRYETPMVPDQPMEQIDTTNSKAPEITGDCDIDVPHT